MPTKIGNHNVKVSLKSLRNAVPGTAVVAYAMDEQHMGKMIVAPIDVLQSQTLRKVCVCCRALRLQSLLVHWRGMKFDLLDADIERVQPLLFS